jgi:hypothetical protein
MAGPVNPKQGFSYDVPSTDVDGNPFPASKIAKYQIGLRRTGSAGTYEMVVDDAQFEAGRQVSAMTLFGNLAYGQWFAAVRAVSTEGPVSAWSPEVGFVLQAVAPSAPGNFSVA